MSERVSRNDDEGLYQPKIHSKRIRELHQISENTGLPMTVIVDQALRKFVEESTNPLPRNSPVENPVFEPKNNRGSGLE